MHVSFLKKAALLICQCPSGVPLKELAPLKGEDCEVEMELTDEGFLLHFGRVSAGLERAHSRLFFSVSYLSFAEGGRVMVEGQVPSVMENKAEQYYEHIVDWLLCH